MKKKFSQHVRRGLPGGPNELNKFTEGFIESSYGQWAYPGQNTLIPNANGRITMKGVNYPVLGIDDEGNQQMMMPGGEYQFPGNDVYEIPMAEEGMIVELSDEEIEEYKRGGYIVEELPKAQPGITTNIPFKNLTSEGAGSVVSDTFVTQDEYKDPLTLIYPTQNIKRVPTRFGYDDYDKGYTEITKDDPRYKKIRKELKPFVKQEFKQQKIKKRFPDEGLYHGKKSYVPSQEFLDQVQYQKEQIALGNTEKQGDTDVLANIVKKEMGTVGPLNTRKLRRKASKYDHTPEYYAAQALKNENILGVSMPSHQEGGPIYVKDKDDPRYQEYLKRKELYDLSREAFYKRQKDFWNNPGLFNKNPKAGWYSHGAFTTDKNPGSKSKYWDKPSRRRYDDILKDKHYMVTYVSGDLSMGTPKESHRWKMEDNKKRGNTSFNRYDEAYLVDTPKDLGKLHLDTDMKRIYNLANKYGIKPDFTDTDFDTDHSGTQKNYYTSNVFFKKPEFEVIIDPSKVTKKTPAASEEEVMDYIDYAGRTPVQEELTFEDMTIPQMETLDPQVIPINQSELILKDYNFPEEEGYTRRELRQQERKGKQDGKQKNIKTRKVRAGNKNIFGQPKSNRRFKRAYRLEEGGYIEAELSDEEIKEYAAGGYIVEEIPEYQDGGVISERGWDYKKEGDKYFTKKSGADNWVTAKGKPLASIKSKIYGEELSEEENVLLNQPEIKVTSEDRELYKYRKGKISLDDLSPKAFEMLAEKERRRTRRERRYPKQSNIFGNINLGKPDYSPFAFTKIAANYKPRKLKLDSPAIRKSAYDPSKSVDENFKEFFKPRTTGIQFDLRSDEEKERERLIGEEVQKQIQSQQPPSNFGFPDSTGDYEQDMLNLLRQQNNVPAEDEDAQNLSNRLSMNFSKQDQIAKDQELADQLQLMESQKKYLDIPKKKSDEQIVQEYYNEAAKYPSPLKSKFGEAAPYSPPVPYEAMRRLEKKKEKELENYEVIGDVSEGEFARQIDQAKNTYEEIKKGIDDNVFTPLKNAYSELSDSPYTNIKQVDFSGYENFKDLKKHKNDMNKMDQSNLIINYQTNKDPNKQYMIVDKEHQRMHLYRGNKLIDSFEVGTGMFKGDEQTISVEKDRNLGNKQTGAGKYTIDNVYEYLNAPSFTMVNDRGIKIPTAIHRAPKSRRDKFGNADLDDNRMSYGCINGVCSDLNKMKNEYNVGSGTEVFVLPEVYKDEKGNTIKENKNKFVYEDGQLIFKSGNAKVNRTPREKRVDGAKPIKFKFDQKRFIDNQFTSTDIDDNVEYNQTVLPFIESLENSKKEVMRVMGVSGDEYNEIAKITFGIFGNESNFGDTHEASSNLFRAGRKWASKKFDLGSTSSPDYKSKYNTYKVRGNSNSVGLTQFRWKWVEDDDELYRKKGKKGSLKDKLAAIGITSNRDFMDPKNAAKATAAILAYYYKTRAIRSGPNKGKKMKVSDIPDTLPREWAGGDSDEKRRDTYARNAIKNSEYLTIMQKK
tara:strand:- start:11047 stop:15558 length:4512 start_codon:yes stop_codon:yes gene_type:complete